MKFIKKDLGLNVIRVDASSQFLRKLNKITDPESKRKIIGSEFIMFLRMKVKLSKM